MTTITADRFLKPFSKKAYDFAFRPPEQDRLINLLWGTVRSSKTWAMMAKLVRLLSYKTEDGAHNIIFGRSKQTVKNNILDNLFTLLGPSNYTFNRQSGELNLMGDPWLVIGAGDEGSEKAVRGMTIGKAYGDEWTLVPSSFLKMVQNRMSVKGARLYGTTNTDSPFHYVKTDILDRLAGTDLLWEEKFTFEDNPWNRPGYYEDLCKMYPPGSLYHQRFVRGLWVTGEGAIYKDVWSEDLLYDDEPWVMSNGKWGAVIPKSLRSGAGVAERSIPVDCGVDHPQVYGDVIDDGKDVWVDREYVWDSHLTNRQKTDRQYREDLEEFLKKAPNAQVIIPPECASFEAELIQSGIWHCTADNDVLDGIKAVSTMMALKRIHFHRRCKRTIAELQTYCWDAKAALRGVEQPLKVKDDAVDMVRYYVRTKIPAWRLAA
jgi:PBSX family phage terminase large subunit